MADIGSNVFDTGATLVDIGRIRAKFCRRRPRSPPTKKCNAPHRAIHPVSRRTIAQPDVLFWHFTCTSRILRWCIAGIVLAPVLMLQLARYAAAQCQDSSNPGGARALCWHCTGTVLALSWHCTATLLTLYCHSTAIVLVQYGLCARTPLLLHRY